jgi:hypothetical protein
MGHSSALQLIYDEMIKAITEHWPDFLPERLPMVFPPYAFMSAVRIDLTG